MHWFLKYKGNDFKGYPFVNNDLFSEGFTKDSLISLKKDLKRSYNKNLSIEERSKIDERIVAKAKKYRSIYANEHPLNYYLISPLKRMKNFLIVNPTQDWPGPSFSESSFSYKSYKIFSIALYLLSIIAVLIYAVLVIIKKNYRSKLGLICLFYSISLMFTFGFLVELSIIMYYATGFVSGWIILIIILKQSKIIKVEKVKGNSS